MRREKYILVFVLLVLVVWWQFRSLGSSGMAANLLHQSAPVFVTETSSGERFDLNNILGKKFLLINFWATWCPPCQEEMPLLNRLQADAGLERLEILALMEDDATSAQAFQDLLTNFRKKIPVAITVLIDPDSKVANQYGTFRLPESYLVDKSGKVVEKFSGVLSDWDVKRIRKMVEE